MQCQLMNQGNGSCFTNALWEKREQALSSWSCFFWLAPKINRRLKSCLITPLVNGLGTECCITVTALDALIYAHSLFHSSVNYRSAVCFGTAKRVTNKVGHLFVMRTNQCRRNK